MPEGKERVQHLEAFCYVTSENDLLRAGRLTRLGVHFFFATHLANERRVKVPAEQEDENVEFAFSGNDRATLDNALEVGKVLRRDNALELNEHLFCQFSRDERL